MVRAAEQRVAEHAERKRAAEQEWITRNWPNATGAAGGILTQRLTAGTATRAEGPLRVRYRGSEVRYMAHIIGYAGPALEITAFGSSASGTPGDTEPQTFPFQPGTTRINAGLDRVIAGMQPGEKRVAIIPADSAYGRGGFYAPEVAGKPRFVISPNTLLFYEIEVLAGQDNRR
jgi:FKBP-type peptidyl-prolyl cis-trans isomerase